jgi:hypothetical protein
MLLAAGRPAEALKELEAVQQVKPNRFRALYGAGRAAELAGDPAAAKRYYGRVVEIAAAADTTRPEIDRQSIRHGQLTRRNPGVRLPHPGPHRALIQPADYAAGTPTGLGMPLVAP